MWYVDLQTDIYVICIGLYEIHSIDCEFNNYLSVMHQWMLHIFGINYNMLIYL